MRLLGYVRANDTSPTVARKKKRHAFVVHASCMRADGRQTFSCAPPCMHAGSCAGALARVTADSDARLTRLNDTRRLLYTGLRGRESEGEQIRCRSVSWREVEASRQSPKRKVVSSFCFLLSFFTFFFRAYVVRSAKCFTKWPFFFSTVSCLVICIAVRW